MDPDQVQVFGIDPVVLHQGVLANNLLDLLGVLWGGGVEDFLAVMDASLDENGHDGERGQPVAFAGDLVQPLTICPASARRLTSRKCARSNPRPSIMVRKRS